MPPENTGIIDYKKYRASRPRIQSQSLKEKYLTATNNLMILAQPMWSM